VQYRYYGQIVMKLEFSDRFSKYAQISSLTKIRPVGTELLQADGVIADGRSYCRRTELLQADAVIAGGRSYCRRTELLQADGVIAGGRSYCRWTELLQADGVIAGGRRDGRTDRHTYRQIDRHDDGNSRCWQFC
jgi:hypothetical protein